MPSMHFHNIPTLLNEFKIDRLWNILSIFKKKSERIEINCCILTMVMYERSSMRQSTSVLNFFFINIVFHSKCRNVWKGTTILYHI